MFRYCVVVYKWKCSPSAFDQWYHTDSANTCSAAYKRKQSVQIISNQHTSLSSCSCDRDANMFLFLFLFGLTAMSPSEGQQVSLQRSNCPMYWYNFNGRCHKYISTHMTWVDAELRCVSEGANLVSIHSQEEQNFVTSLVRNFDPALGFTWIGLSDIHKEGNWIWSDGSPVNFIFWKAQEPNNMGDEDCVHLNYERWNDNKCDRMFPFVCVSRNWEGFCLIQLSHFPPVAP